jgi:hypothetical protein
MRSLLIFLAVSVAATTARAQAPGLSLSFDPAPPPSVPMTREDESLLETGEVGPVRWSLGVGVAAGMGFGLGQTVQGRWRETGWIYTVGEGIAATGLILTIPTFGGDCFSSCHTNQHVVDVMLGSLLVYAGFHVAEVIDAAVGPSFHNARVRDAMARHPDQQLSVLPFVVPSDRGTGGVAGLSLRF